MDVLPRVLLMAFKQNVEYMAEWLLFARMVYALGMGFWKSVSAGVFRLLSFQKLCPAGRLDANMSATSTLTFPPELTPLGFLSTRTGGHMARSMMLSELTAIHQHFPTTAGLADFREGIETENFLGKPTLSSRKKTLHHLRELYGLDPEYALFRNMRMIAAADPSALPLCAVVCAFCRDPQLRASFALIEAKSPGEIVSRAEMEFHLETVFPGRFSEAMKKSLAQNVNTSWMACGHLEGRANKSRVIPRASFGATTFSMFAAWLSGLRGDFLLDSVFARLVACDRESILLALRDGSARGWLRLRSAGGVTEIDFSTLLTNKEITLVHGPH